MSIGKLFAGSVSTLYAKVRPTISEALVEKTMRFLAEKESPPYDLAVDVGCGTGLNTRLIAPHFKKFIGVDISPTQVDEARSTSAFPNANYIVTDSTRLPCRDNSVDLLTVIQTAHWLEHVQFFQECHRLLRPNVGVLAIMGYTMPNLMCKLFPRSQAALTRAMNQFNDTLKKAGAWHPNRYLLDRQYRDINLPYSDQLLVRNDPELYLYKDMAVKTFVDYLSTWSGYRDYKATHLDTTLLEDTKDRILSALPGCVGDEAVLTAVFPWFLLACRKDR